MDTQKPAANDSALANRPPWQPHQYVRHAHIGKLASAVNSIDADFGAIVSPAPANNCPEARALFLGCMERDLQTALAEVRKLQASGFAESFEPGHQHVDPPADDTQAAL